MKKIVVNKNVSTIRTHQITCSILEEAKKIADEGYDCFEIILHGRHDEVWNAILNVKEYGVEVSEPNYFQNGFGKEESTNVRFKIVN